MIGWANFIRQKKWRYHRDIAIVRINAIVVTVLPLNTRTDGSRVIALAVAGPLQLVDPATALTDH